MMKSITRHMIVYIMTALFIAVLIGRLIELQLVKGSEYRKKSTAYVYTHVQTNALRGGIYDRYGRPLVTNTVSMNVVFDRAYLPRDAQNDIILGVTRVLDEEGESYGDTLPISDYPYVFTVYDSDSLSSARLGKLLKLLDMDESASAADIMEALEARYGISRDKGYTESEIRTLVGIRYEMEIRNFANKYPFTLAENVGMKTVARLLENSDVLKGVKISQSTSRVYSNDGIAAMLVGTVGPIYAEEYDALKSEGYSYDDVVGKSGIEKAFESILRGEKGNVIYQQTSGGTLVSVIEEKAPVPGYNVCMSIDLDLQDLLQDSLESTIKNIAETAQKKSTPTKKVDGWDANAGAAVVIDVKSGAVLAMVSYPSYSMEEYKNSYLSLASDPNAPLFNRAISGTYPPGSTFKMATALAALESGTISTSTIIEDKGIYRYYPNYQPKCWIYTDYGRTHGRINVAGAIKGSCNYFFYECGRLMGIDTLNHYCSMLGLGQYTGIEIAGERKGVLAGPAYTDSLGLAWQAGDTIQAAIGQSYNLFTPLQLANYVASLTNGGTRYKTTLLDRICQTHYGYTLYEQSGVKVAEINMSDEVYTAIMEGMRSVTEDGTASATFGKYDIAVGGKTGTASVASGSPNGVFVAFAPYEDPQIAVSIVIEHGTHGNVVAQVAKDVFDYYMKYRKTRLTSYGSGCLIQ